MGSRTPTVLGDSIDITDVFQDSDNPVEFLISSGLRIGTGLTGSSWTTTATRRTDGRIICRH